MRMIQIIVFISILVIPSTLLTNAYLKMEKEVQQRFRNEFKHPIVLLLLIGLLLSLSGIVLAIELIQHIGVSMIFIGWFISSIIGWRKGKSSLITCIGFILLGILGIVAYIFLITYI
jgi:hypothetical protein